MSQTWADQPYTLIPTPKHLGTHTDPADAAFVDVASFMANLHNCIIRGLNSIYLQAPHVPPKDHPHFIKYCLAWCELLEEHHSTEDTRFFVDLEAAAGGNGKSGMLINTEQHEAFHEPLVKFHEYLKQAQKTKEFSGSHLQSLISDFGPTLHSHLQEEIQTLLALKTAITADDVKKALAAADKVAKENLNVRAGLFMAMNMDDTYEGGKWKNFLGAPPVALWILKNIVGRMSSRKSWRYSSCGRDAVPRPLFALKTEKVVKA